MSLSFEQEGECDLIFIFQGSFQLPCGKQSGVEMLVHEAAAVTRGRGACGWVCCYCGGGEKLSGSRHALLVKPKGLAEGSNTECESERGICYDFEVRPERLKGSSSHLWSWARFHAFSSAAFSAAPPRGPRLHQRLLQASAGQREEGE